MGDGQKRKISFSEQYFFREGGKRHSVELYGKGFFGNRGVTWMDVDEYLAGNFEGLVLVRSLQGAGTCLHNLAKDEVRKYVKGMNEIQKSHVWINAAFPADRAIVQGELMQHNGLYFYCSFENGKHMRQALAGETCVVRGLKCRNLIEGVMTNSSFMDLEELLELFPKSVIEISVYEVHVGENPHRNTMFWEVREY